MAESKAKNAPVAENETKYDPWQHKVTVLLPKASDGDQNFVLVGINGKNYQVPRGKRVQVPKPVYDVLSRSEHAQMISERYNAEQAAVEINR